MRLWTTYESGVAAADDVLVVCGVEAEVDITSVATDSHCRAGERDDRRLVARYLADEHVVEERGGSD